MAEIIHTRVTKSTVDRLQPGQMIRDTQLSGFGARRQKAATTYFLQERVDGRVRWLTIGPHGAPWTPESARKEALKLLGAIAGGVDPAANYAMACLSKFLGWAEEMGFRPEGQTPAERSRSTGKTRVSGI